MGDQTIEDEVLLRVTTERGSVPGMPWFGCRLHTLGDVSVRLAEGFILESVNDLIRKGKIRNVEVKAEAIESTLNWEISFEDESGQRSTIIQSRTVG
jgi:phage gp46-like protein